MTDTWQAFADSTDWPVISVLVLNYNGLKHLQPCFKSLQNLEYPPDRLELMLVDNHSSDGSVEFMQARFPTVKIVRHPQNYGFSKGNNLGAEQARGQFVAFLNNDMRVDRRWLSELVQPLRGDPDVVCAGSKILSWDGKHIDFGGSAINMLGFGFQEGWGEPPSARSEAGYVIAPCGGAMLVDRQVFFEIGGFDEDYFAFYEDLDLGWRLWVTGYKVVYAPRAVTYHIHHGWWGQVPGAKVSVLYQRNAFSTLVKNYDDENLARILPVALLLYLRRTYLAAEADVTPFRSESQDVALHLYAEVPHPAIASQAPPGASTVTPEVYDNAYYLREFWRTLRQDGSVQLWCKMTAEVKRRWSHRPRLQLLPGRRIRPRPRPEHTFVADQAIGHLIAADDLVQGWEQLMEKRQAVQSRRRRSDQEIFALFRLPFAADCPDPRYMRTLQDLTVACGIRHLFEQ